MPEKIVSHNSSNEGYQCVTAISELISPSAVLQGRYYQHSCNSYMIGDLCNKFWQYTYLRHFLLTWVQNGPGGFDKKHSILNKQYTHRIIIFCQGDFKEQIKKIGKIVTLHHGKLFKKRPSLGTF